MEMPEWKGHMPSTNIGLGVWGTFSKTNTGVGLLPLQVKREVLSGKSWLYGLVPMGGWAWVVLGFHFGDSGSPMQHCDYYVKVGSTEPKLLPACLLTTNSAPSLSPGATHG